MQSNFVKYNLINFLLITTALQAELLIIKKTAVDTFVPLSEQESIQHGNTISNIFLQYKWPMCISSNLSKKDQNELLAADQPDAEETFIQKKLNEAIPDLDLRVIFIPTCLYELFTLTEYFNNRKEWTRTAYNYLGQTNPLNATVDDISFLKILFYDLKLSLEYKLSLTDSYLISNKIDWIKNIMPQPNFIQRLYLQFNQIFFSSEQRYKIELLFQETLQLIENDISAFIFINQQLTNALYNTYPHLFKNASVSKNIESSIQDITQYFISHICKCNFNSPRIRTDIWIGGAREMVNTMLKHLQNESQNKIVSNVVTLEYEARQKNKALLLRGTTFEETSISLYPSIQKKFIAGNSMLIQEKPDKDSTSKQVTTKRSFLDLYKTKENRPYSISFGNSLFAGFMFDPTACAYYFLSGGRLTNNQAIENKAAPLGYGLLINKKDYIEHQNSNLFFIPPLSSIASLFASGEWFHPRTKAAIATKQYNTDVEIQGVHLSSLEDSFGTILITRDPLKHAELYSKFLAQNGKIIQLGDEKDFTEEEKDFAKKVMHAQTELADLYKSIRTIMPRINNAVTRNRAKKQLGYNTPPKSKTTFL